uniref:CACTA en-spm transposon protein n=1 Tax=Cucumis melo TaxID=3656 RepID=A0A9I9EEM6_CUCME
MNMFVEHQMLTTFKEFRTDCHRHFKKYSDPKEARANPPNALNQMLELQSQMVVSHSMRMKYAIRCWVDDQATQKALVGDPSRRPTERRVQAVRRHLVCSPQKKRLNYKLNFMKLWNGLKYKIEIIKH